MAASSRVAKAPPAPGDPVTPQPRTPSRRATMSAGSSGHKPSCGAATVRPPSCRRAVTGDRPSRAASRACRSTPSTASAAHSAGDRPKSRCGAAAIPAHVVATIVSAKNLKQRETKAGGTWDRTIDVSRSVYL